MSFYQSPTSSHLFHCKPSMIKVHDNFSRFGFYGDYVIGLLDASHILNNLARDDYY